MQIEYLPLPGAKAVCLLCGPAESFQPAIISLKLNDYMIIDIGILILPHLL